MSTATLSAVKPVYLGPTWQRDEGGRFLLPKRSLGWHILTWCGQKLQHANGNPWRYTPEQARLTIWWYAVDDDDRFVFHDGVVQRLKGWGKDPVAATWSAVEFVGPCRPSGRTEKFSVPPWVEPWQPVGAPHPEAWAQIAAVSKDQTRNTMTLFPGLFPKSTIREYEIDLGKEIIYAHHGQQRIEAVTSSPRALEGGRPTTVIRNETHHWLSNNEGHEMDAVIERNAVKSSDGLSRAVSITNAYEPSEDSVAQRAREAFDAMESGDAVATGILYDSVEAPPDAPLSAEAAPGVVEAIRGDSVWLNTDRVVKSILDARNPPSRSRRFWYNQITAAEDAWVTPQQVDAAATNPEVDPEDEWAAFFDGSKSDDSSGLIAARLSDGLLVTLGVWQKPPGDRGKGWLAPREEIDQRVDAAFDEYDVVAFFADPSHAKDDADSTGYWDSVIDGWHRRYSERLRHWAVQSGASRHSVMWDMSSSEHQRQFTEAAMRFTSELEDGNVAHDGHPALRQHMKNARRYPNRFGVSLWKGHRESARKIDLAVCAVGARMLRRLVLNAGPSEKPKKPRTGRVVGF